MKKIDNLIINSAYQEPSAYWKYDPQRQSFDKIEGRRPAGYFISDQSGDVYGDNGIFVELPLVNLIRGRVKSWRERGYPGVTGVTGKLLEYWNDDEVRRYPFFWCQKEAVETLIWLTEAAPEERSDLTIPSDGGPFRRICTKLCTGGGKTTVMAMLIVWHVCNKASYPRAERSDRRALASNTGTPRRWQAASRLGHNSVSMTMPKSGRKWRRKRATNGPAS